MISRLRTLTLDLAPARDYEPVHFGSLQQYLFIEFTPGVSVEVKVEQFSRKRASVIRASAFYGLVEEDAVYLTHKACAGQIKLHFSPDPNDLPLLTKLPSVDVVRRYDPGESFDIPLGDKVLITGLDFLSQAEWETVKELTVHLLLDPDPAKSISVSLGIYLDGRDFSSSIALTAAGQPGNVGTPGGTNWLTIMGILQVVDVEIGGGIGPGASLTIHSPGAPCNFLVLEYAGVAIATGQLLAVARF